MAMLFLGKWLSSKARLLLVLFTGLGRADLNYLRFPLVNTTETKTVCLCVGEGGWEGEGVEGWKTGMKKWEMQRLRRGEKNK